MEEELPLVKVGRTVTLMVGVTQTATGTAKKVRAVGRAAQRPHRHAAAAGCGLPAAGRTPPSRPRNPAARLKLPGNLLRTQSANNQQPGNIQNHNMLVSLHPNN